MMKFIANQTERKETYPCLKSTENGLLTVLFNSPNHGIVVSNPTKNYSIGYYSNDWEESEFEPVTGTLVFE